MLAVVTGYCAFGIYSLVAAALLALFFRPRTPIGQWVAQMCADGLFFEPLLFRYALYAIMMAFLCLMAALNTFELVVDTELAVNPTSHLLDALVWAVAFAELFATRPPPELADDAASLAHSKSERKLVTRASYVCLAVLTLASFVSSRSRFVAYLAVAPLMVCMAYHLYAARLWQESRSTRTALLAFVVLGVYALVLALLGPGFTHVLSNGLYFLLAGLGHMALFGTLFCLRLKTRDTPAAAPLAGQAPPVAHYGEEADLING